MSDELLGVVPWWQVAVTANVVISVSYFAILVLIVVPLIRHDQLRANRLAAATAAIFLTCAVGRAIYAIYPVLQGRGAATGSPWNQTTWWMAVWHVATAAVAVYYLSLRRLFGDALVSAPLFVDLQERQRHAALEEIAAAGADRDEAKAQRDAYAHMLRSIIENSASAIYVKDLEGRYLMANTKLVEIMGRPENEILGETDDQVDPALAEQWHQSDLRAQTEQYRTDEWNDVYPDGRHYYDTVKFPLFDSTGAVYATCGISADVTEQKRAVLDLAEARDAALAATAAKSAFLATMSHEIRTPMNAVIGMTDLLVDTDLDDQQAEFAEMVRSSGQALLAVINDILDYSKIESGQLLLEAAPFDLIEEIEGCMDLVAVAASVTGLDLVSYIDQDCPVTVNGDSVRVGQIIANLLSNAVKFTERGEVLLTAKAVSTVDGRLQLSVTVADTGIGITQSGIETLFGSFTQVDPSTTRVYGGTGLGLAISARLTQAMGGQLTVTSTPGVGSTFTAVVILEPSADAVTVDDLSRAAAADLAGKRALLVDDNATNLRILNLQLTNVGMTCTSVGAAADALALVRSGATYDLAILDMRMPEMNGLELAIAMNAVVKEPMPLMLLTSIGARPAGVAETFSAFLTKPVKSAVLLRTLSSVLRPGARSDIRQSATAPPHWESPSSLQILLAEDNPVNQRVAQLTLEKLGYLVDLVGNGREAVEAVSAGSYDLVLMDVQMPEMDGLAATREIRSVLPEHRQPRIVAMTASALVEDRLACTEAGMDGYLAKPVRAVELQSVLTGMAASVAARDHAPAVDESVLDELMAQVGGDATMRAGIIGDYLDESAGQLQSLLAAGATADATAVLSLAHTMRSTSELLGAGVLAQQLRGVEELARTDPAALPALTAVVEREYARVALALAAMRGAETTSA